MAEKIRLSFLGTNGWYTDENGNSVCAVIETGRSYIVLDAGEGLRLLGKFATRREKRIDLYLSHFHLDHVIGLHTLPALARLGRIRIFGQPGTGKVIAQLVNHPFTASFAELRGLGLEVSVHELKEGRNKIPGADYAVVAAPLVHADPCFGYRFETKGKTIAYCTDTGACENIVKLARGADALITECGMLPGGKEDSEWPHLSPEKAARLAKRAICKKLFLTHFGAHLYRTKESRKGAERAARKIFGKSFAAKDGMEVGI